MKLGQDEMRTSLHHRFLYVSFSDVLIRSDLPNCPGLRVFVDLGRKHE